MSQPAWESLLSTLGEEDHETLEETGVDER